MRWSVLLLWLAACGGTSGTPVQDSADAGVDAVDTVDAGDADAGDLHEGDVGGPDGDAGEVPDADAGDTGDACETDDAYFARVVSPVLQGDCVGCHSEGGPAQSSRNVLLPSSSDDHLAHNAAVLRSLVGEEVDGLPLLLAKPIAAVSHGGGPRFEAESEDYAALAGFVARTLAPGGCETPELEPACDPHVPHPGATPLRRLTDVQYANAVRDLTGVEPPIGLFPTTQGSATFATFATENTVSVSGAEGIMLSAEYVAEVVASDARGFLGCEGELDTCVQAWVEPFLRRALRRPATAEELELVRRVMALEVEPAQQLARALELTLQSPAFLYLDTVGGAEFGEGIAYLDDYAIAARLSFFLWETTPDDGLLDLAAAGRLHTREQVVAEATRMVNDPRVVDVVARFHSDWLHVYQLDTIAKSESRYPEFGPALVADMRRETELFVTEVVWFGDGTFDGLLNSPWTWTTPELDALYGTTDQRQGDGWERRRLGGDRPGVLTRTAFLAAHSYSETSAPVRRGAFVLTRMLCEELEPPTNVELDLIPPTETNTIRDRLAVHREAEACSGCHNRIDPVGYSFENYGALGEWRDVYANGIEVDATGELENPTGSFDGVPGMLATLDDERRLGDCYVVRLFEYANGRSATAADTCRLDGLQRRFHAGGRNLRDLFVQIAVTDAFLLRDVEAQ